uniref:ATP synthase complex subunit 8 n=1 Tax=Dinoderus minutus TaxID=1587246 RepID=A0A343C1B5_9COLE|nr:ATP synthase F0 subunit 8 [Dinoderus minutus]
MPQMAPLNWLMLFLFFTLILISMNSMNFFNFLYKTSNKKNEMEMKKNSWKW